MSHTENICMRIEDPKIVSDYIMKKLQIFLDCLSLNSFYYNIDYKNNKIIYLYIIYTTYLHKSMFAYSINKI